MAAEEQREPGTLEGLGKLVETPDPLAAADDLARGIEDRLDQLKVADRREMLERLLRFYKSRAGVR